MRVVLTQRIWVFNCSGTKKGQRSQWWRHIYAGDTGCRDRCQ